jgi:hypothetical protein
MAYVIKSATSGRYYREMSGIGPAFTADREEAAKFKTMAEAAKVMGTHSIAFGDCELESSFTDEEG